MFEKKYEVWATALLGNGETYEPGTPKLFITRRGAFRYRDQIQRISNEHKTPLTYHAGRIGFRGYSYEIVDNKAEGGYCPFRIIVRYQGRAITHGGTMSGEYAHRKKEARKRALEIAAEHRDRNKPKDYTIEKGVL